jgi:hypothetical protein
MWPFQETPAHVRQDCTRLCPLQRRLSRLSPFCFYGTCDSESFWALSTLGNRVPPHCGYLQPQSVTVQNNCPTRPKRSRSAGWNDLPGKVPLIVLALLMTCITFKSRNVFREPSRHRYLQNPLCVRLIKAPGGGTTLRTLGSRSVSRTSTSISSYLTPCTNDSLSLTP